MVRIEITGQAVLVNYKNFYFDSNAALAGLPFVRLFELHTAKDIMDVSFSI